MRGYFLCGVMAFSYYSKCVYLQGESLSPFLTCQRRLKNRSEFVLIIFYLQLINSGHVDRSMTDNSTVSFPFQDKYNVNEHQVIWKVMLQHRRKCPHMMHFNVPCDWFETNSRHQKRYSEDGKKFCGCRSLLGRVVVSDNLTNFLYLNQCLLLFIIHRTDLKMVQCWM